MFLCLHDSATTNIYTHGHTLSRRGSRPLYVSVQMDMVSVAAQVGGLITEGAVRGGQQVAKGQLLFRIDGHPYALSVAQANAAIDSAQVDVGNLSASLATTRVDIAKAKEDIAFAEVNFQRQAALKIGRAHV